MKKGLGKGLEALLGESSTENASRIGSAYSQLVENIKINNIDPNMKQPRKRFDDEAMEELASSIRVHGVVQPIIVRRQAGGYGIIAGERRWRAAKKAGLAEIPVIIKDVTEQQVMELALIENLQRQDLNVIEEANAYKQLIEEYGMTHADLSTMIGKSRVDITNKLRLLRLPEKVLEYVENGEVSAGHARALLALDSEKDMIAMAQRISTGQLSVRQTEGLVKKVKSKGSTRIKLVPNSAELTDLQTRLAKYFETPVRIITRKKGSKIVIDCGSDDILNAIIEKLEV